MSKDYDIPNEDLQKYILATSDFAKSIQTDIIDYVTRDRINDASFRQKWDRISKKIIRKQNALELVFGDISTFDGENPILGSLLREIDLSKKQTDSEFIKSLPSQPRKELEIQKQLDKLRDLKRINSNNRNNRNNNNNNNNNNNDSNNNNDNGCLFPPGLPGLVQDQEA